MRGALLRSTGDVLLPLLLAEMHCGPAELDFKV